MELLTQSCGRYARHVALAEIGEEGQSRLRSASVALVGVGGLGSAVALYLAAAGVGRLGLIDGDRVELSNLQRQVLHSEPMIGAAKIDSARARLSTLNSEVKVVGHGVRLDSQNAVEILAGYDVVVDATDNLTTRYVTNEACVRLGKANIYGAISQFEGQASVFLAPEGPCYCCLFPEPPAVEAPAAGVLGVVPGVIGVIQATEAIKQILGLGESLLGRLLLYDALAMSFRTIALRRNPQCGVCGSSEHAGRSLPVG